MSATSELEDFSLQAEDNEAFSVDSMSTEQLLSLHAKIEARLGGLTLPEVNLVKETLLQIHRGKALQESASTGNFPLNQRAQVQNSLGNMLVQLGRLQVDLFNSERIKRIQSAVIRVVKTLPQKQQDHFFELLEDELAREAKETDQVEVIGGAR